MSRRTTGGTLAAWLIIAAIVGFAGGAFFGVQSGSGDPGPKTTTSDNNQQQSGTPEPTGEATTSPAGDVALTISPKKVKAGEKGRFDINVKVDPPEEGVALKLQRSLDGGDTWEDAFDLALSTDADGEASSSAWSGRVGENLLRVVGISDDSLVSNEFALEVTE